MHVEIGGGTLELPAAAVNIDPVHGSAGFQHLAQLTPWRLENNVADTARASHVMEHVPSGQARIDVFNEMHRVLKPAGEFTVIVPGAVARGPGEMLGWWAIADPTHVSLWVPESFHYFDGTFAANADYGIKPWNTKSLEIVNGWEIHWVGTIRE